jgi:hypothetical protein
MIPPDLLEYGSAGDRDLSLRLFTLNTQVLQRLPFGSYGQPNKHHPLPVTNRRSFVD